MARCKPLKAQRADGAQAALRASQRDSGIAVEAECEALDGCVPEYEARNLATWLNYQMARWLVRTGRTGKWTISAKISRKGVK